MQTARLFIRPIKKEDEISFISGISDNSLCAAYGFPTDMNTATARNIFTHFLSIGTAYSLIRTNTETMIGFLLDVPPELPENIASGLPDNGRTLAYSVFPAFQRQGYMEEALRAYISSMESGYIHCGHYPENTPSKKLLRKLGFHEWTSHQAGSRMIVDEILYPVILT